MKCDNHYCNTIDVVLITLILLLSDRNCGNTVFSLKAMERLNCQPHSVVQGRVGRFE